MATVGLIMPSGDFPVQMRLTHIVSLVVAAVLMSGCGGDKVEEKPQGVIPEHQLKALEKAENVEDVLKEAEKARLENGEG
jgi:hypothetical protein